jgi:hypothetical protein
LPGEKQNKNGDTDAVKKQALEMEKLEREVEAL